MGETAVCFDIENSEPVSNPQFIPLPSTPRCFTPQSESSISSKEENEDSTGVQLNKNILSPLKIVAPLSQPLKGAFKLLQMWEGRVINSDLDKHEFTAIILDKSNPENGEEEVTLSLEEISPDDLKLLSNGAIFYWSIGYADYPGRPRSRESRLRFRRLPNWSILEIDKARRRGEQLAEILKTN